jgi:hypothetical protein
MAQPQRQIPKSNKRRLPIFYHCGGINGFCRNKVRPDAYTVIRQNNTVVQCYYENEQEVYLYAGTTTNFITTQTRQFMKKATLLAVTALLLLSFKAGVNKIAKEKFCGKKWHITKMMADGKTREMKDDKSYVEFKADGTMISASNDYTDTYNYDYDESTNTVSVKMKDGTVNLKDEILKVDDKHLEMKQTVIAVNATMTVYCEAK